MTVLPLEFRAEMSSHDGAIDLTTRVPLLHPRVSRQGVGLWTSGPINTLKGLETDTMGGTKEKFQSCNFIFYF